MTRQELIAALRAEAEKRYTPVNDGNTEYYMAAERATLEAAALALIAIDAEHATEGGGEAV